MTSSAYHELYALVKCNRQEAIPSREPLREQEITPLQIDMQTPFVPNERSAFDEISEYQFAKDGSVAGPSAGNGIVEPLQDQSQDNDLEKLTECKDITTDCT